MKKMEELGIGRPSTYASILSVLQDRKYVRLDKRRFIPEDRGRLVTAFLVSFFEHYVDTGFTAGAGGKARRHLRRPAGLAQGDARVLGRVLQGGRADPRPEDQRRHQRAGPGSGPAFLPGARGWLRPAGLRRLRQRPAGSEAGPLRQFHRLLQLSGVPVHPPAGDRCRRRRRRDAEGGHARRWASIPRPARRSPSAAGPYGLYVQQGEDDRGQEGPAQAHLAAARHGRRAD